MIELGSHQLRALNKMSNGSILTGGVGTGKSRTALAYYLEKEMKGRFPYNGQGEFKEPQKPRDIYIFTTKKKRDELEWEGEAKDFLISRDPENSIGGVKLTVDVWNNITKYQDLRGAFVIFDEQRLVGNGAWVKAFYKLAKTNRWVILSATPGDTWMDYIPVFIARGYYRNRTEFIRRHVVYSQYTKFPKVERYLDAGLLETYRRATLVEMPYTRHTNRNLIQFNVEYDRNLFQTALKKRWNVFDGKPVQNIAELWGVLRKVVNSDPSRLGGVLKLMEKHPRLIIFYNFTYELDILRTIQTATGVETKEWNGKKHDPLPTGDKWVYLVQYTAGAEGWNCITTDSMVFYSLNYSYKIFEQAQGRTDRLNTPYRELYYYIFRSASMVDQAIWKNLGTKRNFSEAAFIKKWENA